MIGDVGVTTDQNGNVTVDPGNFPDSGLWQKAKGAVEDLGIGVAAGGAVAATALATAAAIGIGPSAILLGASLGSVVPVIGTAIGAVIGALAALFAFFKKNPHPGIDDAYWDTLGNEGDKTHEPNGLDISTAQIALVQQFAGGIIAQPNWRARWPDLWNGMAHSTNPHSSLLADAVARMLGVPQGGAPAPPPVAPVRIPVPVPIVRAPGAAATGTVTRAPGQSTLGGGYGYGGFVAGGVAPPAPLPVVPKAIVVTAAQAQTTANYLALQKKLAELAKPAGISTGSKVALGAVAAGALGVGAAHAAGYPVLSWASAAVTSFLKKRKR